MKLHMTATAALLGLLALATTATAAVGQPRTAGGAGSYDRNATLVQDGAVTDMFFARSENACNRLAGCDADNSQYDMYLKTSTDGGKTFGPAQLVAPNPDGAGNHRGRTLAATRTSDGTVYVFWADGGSQSPLYYVKETAPGSGTFPSTATPVAGPGLEDV